MKRFLSLFFVCFFFGFCKEDAIIKESYTLSRNEIYSTDLIPNSPRFLIARFGEHFTLTLSSQKLQELFSSHSIPFQTPFSQITFIYDSTLPLKDVKEKIALALKEQYPTIKIQKIRLKPIGSDLGREKVFELKTIQNAIFKKKTFQILLNTSSGVVPFLCEVDARVEVYVAKEDIRAREDLDSGNVERKSIEFDGFLQPPISEREFLSSSARSFIKQGQIITTNKIKPKLFVKKGDMIEVSYQEGGVKISARLEAMQNGSLGEEIRAINPTSKKTLKVKITAQGKGEIR